ncbi:hypothetical protein Y5S_00075 [Alcanivorax nanhaiticus]|uniref:Uncharacterized protein n=1 Tax=Alcanivorax nanhaiticus TaxID=1177154 RepID=A0A095TVI6_9GAMM|nr:hypothetical protein Y5S_00075 [Alcanivorax nanhaiticus]
MQEEPILQFKQVFDLLPQYLAQARIASRLAPAAVPERFVAGLQGEGMSLMNPFLQSTLCGSLPASEFRPAFRQAATGKAVLFLWERWFHREIAPIAVEPPLLQR